MLNTFQLIFTIFLNFLFLNIKVEIGQMVLKKILKDHQFSLFGKGRGPLNKYEFSSPKDALIVSSLVEIGPELLEKIFRFRHCSFPFSSLSPLEWGVVI